MSNFDYIPESDGLDVLKSICITAEELQTDNPKESANNCRKAIEFVAQYVAGKNNISDMTSASLSVLLDDERVVVALDNLDLQRPIRQVRRRSNAAFNLGEDLDGMPYVVELLFHIVGVMLLTYNYIAAIPTFEPLAGAFDIPLDGEI